METNFSAEQGVLGGLMEIADLSLDVPQKVMSMVKPSSFQTVAHQIIYKAIVEVYRSGQRADMISVEAYLIRTGEAEKAGRLSYIAELCKNSIVSGVLAHADIVRQAAIKAAVISNLNNAMAMVNDADGRTIYEKLGELESTVTAMLTRSLENKSTGLVHARDICDKWSIELQDRFDNPSESAGYSTGIEGLDLVLAPKLIRKGSLVVVGARPKMGKTALLGSMVKHFTLNLKKSAALFSLEMPSDQIMERMLCERANVNGNIFYEGAQCDSEFARVSAAMGEYMDSSLYMDDTPAMTINHIQRESRKLAKREDVGLIAIDYLTLMKAEKADRNDLAYGEITKSLKNLAKELDCVVLLLTQLNRGLESRPNKRPMPSDSRDTGQIEQDCDVWMGLYREGVYDESLSPEKKGLTELIVRLNRHGETGTAYLNLKNGYFVEASQQDFNFGTRQQRDEDF